MLSRRFHLQGFNQIAFAQNWESFLLFEPTCGDPFGSSNKSGPCTCVSADSSSLNQLGISGGPDLELLQQVSEFHVTHALKASNKAPLTVLAK